MRKYLDSFLTQRGRLCVSRYDRVSPKRAEEAALLILHSDCHELVIEGSQTTLHCRSS